MIFSHIQVGHRGGPNSKQKNPSRGVWGVIREANEKTAQEKNGLSWCVRNSRAQRQNTERGEKKGMGAQTPPRGPVQGGENRV